jgi:predicted nuclease of predicted toxin-antitoxin system
VRFIVDESSGVTVARYLQSAGHDVLYVGDVMPQADDNEILELALAEKRVLISNDKDFSELVFRGGFEHSGVLLLRLQEKDPTIASKS